MSLLTFTNQGLNRGYVRRLNREIQTLADNLLEVDSTYDEEKKTHTVSILLNNNLVDFRLPQMYPFKSPGVLWNGKHYRDMLIFRTEYFQQVLRDNDITCLCCNSLLCTSNWSPMCTLVDLANEIERNKNFIQAILRTRLVRQVCQSMGVSCQEIPDLILNYLIVGKRPIVRNDIVKEE
tara:strand:+ start:1550 stop:2086 length:537 start_codon:yes stop_codon:yes gene_type:complete